MQEPQDDERAAIVHDSEQQIRLVGPLDAFSAPSIEDELITLATARALLTIDLTEVAVLTSGGLAVLERCRSRAVESGHRLRLRVREDSAVQRVLKVAAPPDLLVPVVEHGLVPGELPPLATGA